MNDFISVVQSRLALILFVWSPYFALVSGVQRGDIEKGAPAAGALVAAILLSAYIAKRYSRPGEALLTWFGGFGSLLIVGLMGNILGLVGATVQLLLSFL